MAPRSPSPRGYTAVEVIMAIGLLAVGAAAVVAMERGAIVASGHARDLDVANSVATLWIERLRTDATQWTRDGFDMDASTEAGATLNGTLQGTRYFMESSTQVLIDRGRVATDRGWFLPNQGMSATPMQSPAFDALGRELGYLTQANPTPTTPDVHFCTHVRLECLSGNAPDSGPILPSQCVLLRVQVRVFWPKVNNSRADFCSATNLSDVEDNPQQFNFVYATTALRMSAPSQ